MFDSNHVTVDICSNQEEMKMPNKLEIIQNFTKDGHFTS